MNETNSGHGAGIRAQIDVFNVKGPIQISAKGRERLMEQNETPSLPPSLPPKTIGAAQFSFDSIEDKKYNLKPNTADKPPISNKPNLPAKPPSKLGRIHENPSDKQNDNRLTKPFLDHVQNGLKSPPPMLPKPYKNPNNILNKNLDSVFGNKLNDLLSPPILIGCDGKKYRLQKIPPATSEPPQKPALPQNIVLPVLEVITAPSKVDSAIFDDQELYDDIQEFRGNLRNSNISLIPTMTADEEADFEKNPSDVSRDSQWYDDTTTITNDLDEEDYDDVDNVQQELYEVIDNINQTARHI